MSRHNYTRKRNRQLYCSSMESQTVLLDPCRYTMVRQDALRWNWMSQAKMRASASLRQFWLTHADALHFQIQCSDSSGCNTRIKVKHQITKLLTKVLTHADALRWDRMHYGETECLKQRCGCSEPRVTTYRRQARYKSRTNSCADQLHAFTKQTEHKLAVETRKIMRFYQKLAAKHRMTATRQHAAGLQNLQGRAPRPPKEALEMLTVMFARPVQGGAGSSLVSMETQY